jgi:transcriptional regulator with XRE-family HTH domain
MSDEMAQGDHWSTQLRRHRERKGLTREGLAARAGISASAIKSIERGKRHPKEDTLKALTDALGLTRDEANPIRLAAGYSVDWYGLLHERYPSTPEDLQAQVDEYPWPAFITNQSFDLLHANRAFELVWDVDLSRERLGPGERNFLSGATEPRFLDYVDNFDELVTYMIGLVKGDPRWQQSPANPAPWLQDVMDKLSEGNPRLFARIGALWQQAEPIPHRSRHIYHVSWRHRGETPMRFVCSTSIADLWNELSWNEWVPADAESWSALKHILG